MLLRELLNKRKEKKQKKLESRAKKADAEAVTRSAGVAPVPTKDSAPFLRTQTLATKAALGLYTGYTDLEDDDEDEDDVVCLHIVTHDAVDSAGRSNGKFPFADAGMSEGALGREIAGGGVCRQMAPKKVGNAETK